jgi:trk system potassium uptake protein TrkA
MKRQVLVIGLGRFGTSVVQSLYNLGHDVLAIDSDETRVQAIMGQATHALTADATNETVLRDLGIQDYDAAVVAIGSNIVPSIMASVLLKTMGVPYVVSRAYNELHGNTLERIGVDKVIHAESEMGVRLAHNLFNPNVQEYLEVTPNYGISKMKVPTHFANMSLKELGFSNARDKYGLAVVAINRRGTDITLNPDTNDRLQAGDWLVLAGRDELLDRLDLASDGRESS